jgi:HEAT repeat protein
MRAVSVWFCIVSSVLGQVPSPAPAAGASNETRARGFLDQALTDKNPDSRKQAVQALGLVGSREPYISQLESMLDDKDLEVQLATITSLVDLNNKRTVPDLQKALDSEVPEVSFAAAKALWALNVPAGREALISVLSGETKVSSGFVTKQKREALRMVHTPKTMFMFAVKTGVGFAPVPGLGMGISSLQGILSDPGVSGRAATALLLGADKDPAVLPALLDALDDKDWSVRASAVHAIALRDNPALEKALIPLFDDKNGAVRVRAAAGYLRLEWIRSSARKAPLKPKKPATLPNKH